MLPHIESARSKDGRDIILISNERREDDGCTYDSNFFGDPQNLLCSPGFSKTNGTKDHCWCLLHILFFKESDFSCIFHDSSPTFMWKDLALVEDSKLWRSSVFHVKQDFLLCVWSSYLFLRSRDLCLDLESKVCSVWHPKWA